MAGKRECGNVKAETRERARAFKRRGGESRGSHRRTSIPCPILFTTSLGGGGVKRKCVCVLLYTSFFCLFQFCVGFVCVLCVSRSKII